MPTAPGGCKAALRTHLATPSAVAQHILAFQQIIFHEHCPQNRSLRERSTIFRSRLLSNTLLKRPQMLAGLDPQTPADDIFAHLLSIGLMRITHRQVQGLGSFLALVGLFHQLELTWLAIDYVDDQTKLLCENLGPEFSSLGTFSGQLKAQGS